MPHECFADEIAIDFPASARRRADARVVSRRATGADLDDVMRLEVQVTRREVWEGASVPVEVPLRGVCRHCGGRGEDWTEPCEVCAGTGVTLDRRLVRVPLPRGVADGARFRFRVSSPQGDSVRLEVRVAIVNRVIE